MESQIIKKAKSGDSEALTILIDKYKNIAFNLALSIVKDKDNAKDITQDSFIKVLENIKYFRSNSKFSTWLYRIVYNQSLSFIKKANYLNSFKNNYYSDFELPEIFENEDETLQQLNKAIDLLDNNEKNILLLFYYAEKSIKEISQITGLSKSNIKVILHRTRKKLKDKINNE
jgi:RNA polymerase sigma-70 factor (ECF subfamily)